MAKKVTENTSPSKITLTYEGKVYTLEFSRETVVRLEKEGFIADEALKFPVTYLPQLFHGAFYMHHPEVGQKLSDKILESCKDKIKLVGYLGAMYNKPAQTLIVDDGEDEKNTTWEANW